MSPPGNERHTLARRERLRSHNDFTKVERTGTRAQGASVTVVHVVRRDGRSRVGFTVSKKVSLSAVVRNRVRRRLKEIVRRNKTWIAARDVIIIAKPESATRSLQELATELATLFAGIERKP
jgi:ribonuclease P protein component